MSDRTAPALAKLDALIDGLKSRPPAQVGQSLMEDVDALRRGVASFHMEAIRFRMYSVDRALHHGAGDDELKRLFEDLRRELEALGFHTRSHTAP